jgi:hypothetical protein
MTMIEVVDDERHRVARPADDRLPDEDCRIDHDAFVDVVVHHG